MSLFLNMSNILAVFNVSKPLDKYGMEVDLDVAWNPGPTMLVSLSFLLYWSNFFSFLKTFETF